MYRKALIICLGLLPFLIAAQNVTPNLQKISIQNNDDFEGFELLELTNERLFVLAEHWHNIRSVPSATLKLLRYLHANANVRVLAIEQGKSVAMMINQYLETGDSTMLQHITRNTMFWGKENRQFFKELLAFNAELPSNDKFVVESIDIEYKMESAIFMINRFIDEKTIPDSLIPTVGEFKRIYEETKDHREQYDGLAIMFYYDREYVQELLIATINDMDENRKSYEEFFGQQYSDFQTMIMEMDDGLEFDYTNPNNNYKFRDRIIQRNFIELADKYPNSNILCPIGARHANKQSSIGSLRSNASSPFRDQVMIIRVSALYAKAFNSGDLRKINFNYPQQLKVNEATLIKHSTSDPALKSNKGYDYTLFINENGSLTPFENILTEDY